MNITDPIRHIARINPNSIAVIRVDGIGVSYRDFDRLIDATAAVLPEFGIEAGQIVGLAIDWPDQFPGLVTALALARLGATSAPMSLPAKHLNVCITEPGGPPPRPEVRSVPNPTIWMRAQQAAASARPVVSHPGGSAICRIFATSGTTGLPKFVAFSHDRGTNWMISVVLCLGGEPAVRLCAIGLGIVFGYFQALRTFWTGGTLVLAPYGPAQSLAAIARHAVSSLEIAPIMLSELLAEVERRPPPPLALKVIEVGGSALPEPVRTKAERLLCRRLVSLYGATETGLVASAPLTAFRDDPLVVGFVTPGAEVEAVDADGQKLPPGREGALRNRGPDVAQGYFGDEATSAELFRDGWFYGGDVGSVSPDGVLRITGRTGEVINAGGNKVSPRVIEDVLLSVPKVSDAAAIEVPDQMGVAQIWAAIAAPEPLPGEMLKALCRERLRHLAPTLIVQFQKLPRNANGKLLRDELVKAAVAQTRQAATPKLP